MTEIQFFMNEQVRKSHRALSDWRQLQQRARWFPHQHKDIDADGVERMVRTSHHNVRWTERRLRHVIAAK